MDKKELPIGNDSFREVRESGYYVDKTAFIARMIDEAKHNFLSRPRRFGKSLLVHTLKELFEGNEKLFRGLYIHDKWDWKVEYPVLRLDFGGGGITNPDDLNENVMVQLGEIEEQEGVSTTAKTSKSRLLQLIKALHRNKKQRVVVLVDEYDKPINNALDMLGSDDVARANRSYLSDLYSTIKQCNENIRFSFLTGVSKFAHAGDLSTVVGGRRREAATDTIGCVSAARSGQPRPLVSQGLNNLRDITIDPRYSSICGYTDQDIDTVFASELERSDREKLDREEIREWYNGYSWSGDEKMYNPFSILLLFDRRRFEDWWFRTATPTFLIETLKKRGGIGTLDLTGMYTGSDLLSAIDVGNIEVPALLFQTGYLTITDVDDSGGKESYHLDFPNREVRESLHQYLLRAIAPDTEVALHTKLLRNALVSGDFDSVEAQLRAMFSNIAHSAYNPSDIAKYEGHYASNAHTCLAGTGFVVRPEDPTNHGNIDLTVEAGTRIYVFEFKVLRPGVERGAAMRQLRDMNYADKYRARGVPIHLIGVEFDVEDRNIKHFDIETL